MSKSVPNKYFENLSAKILDNIDHLEDEIQLNAPTLNKVSKTMVYSIPEFYFQNQRHQILKKVKGVGVIRMGMFRVAAAACIALLFYFSASGLLQDQQNNDSFAENEILDFYLENTDEIELTDLTGLNIEEEIGYTDLFADFEDEELEIYLSDIIEELAIEKILENNI